MKFGLLYLPTYQPELDGPYSLFYEHMLEQVQRGEALGFEGVWFTEHHFNRYGGAVPNPAILGAAIAQRTRRIRIGVAVSVLPLHNPLFVAEDYAMLDVLSGGRLDFGVGRGSVAAEYQQLKVPEDTSPTVMEEATDLILVAWRGQPFSFEGEHFNYHGITLLPTPVQRPHPPVWVGASRSHSTYAWAGRKGFHIMVLPYLIPLDELGPCLDVYRASLSQAGHDADQRHVFAKFHVFAADSRAEARRYAEPALLNYYQTTAGRSHLGKPTGERDPYDAQAAERKMIFGTPDDCVEAISYWQERLGVTYIGGLFHFGGLDQAAALRSIELFGREVAPHFGIVSGAVAGSTLT